MSYEYSGYLATLLDAPDAQAGEVDYIDLTPDDLMHWVHTDDPGDREWQKIPATIERRDESVALRGNFEGVRRIDNLAPDDPSYWAPLSSRHETGGPFPVDLSRYPIVEITYRCKSAHARPAWTWRYEGGLHFDGLQPSATWRTIARLAQHNGFPSQIEGMTLRLYSTTRSSEEMEVNSIRFRALTDAERTALEADRARLAQLDPPAHYRLLDEMMPLGVFMNAQTAKKLADTIEISFRDYWRLAFEDIARFHHNSVVLEGMFALSPVEWREVLGLASSFGIRMLPVYDWPLDAPDLNLDSLVRSYVAPYTQSPAMLGWCIKDEPAEHTFHAHLEARKRFEIADPKHPMTTLMRDPNAFPLFAPHVSASSIAHFKSGAAWDLGPLVQAHISQSRGQQFWVTSPAFVYATDAPEWNSCPEVRLMLNLAFANGARGWFSFCYHNDPIWAGGSFQRSLTGPFLAFSDIWSELGTRMERFTALAPLFLHARPSGAQEVGFEITATSHPRARKPEGMEPIQWHWLQGEDYALIYVVSNDIGEVTPVWIKAPEHLPKGLEIYDMTDFVRNLNWVPMQRHRHLEMFPGQGQILLLAEPAVCERIRDEIVERIIEDDRRQISMNLSLARRYDIDITEVQNLMKEVGMGQPLHDVQKMHSARNQLTNKIYRTPKLVTPRSKLIEASAALCGADGCLCRLLAKGRPDEAHELGLKVLPLARELARLRLNLRRGRGPDILDECAVLAQKACTLLEVIRASRQAAG